MISPPANRSQEREQGYNTPAAVAAKAATRTIPIVFQVGVDPVQYGLVTSLARPGGNLTGLTGVRSEVIGKRLELLHEMAPTATSIAYLFNPTNPTSLADGGEELQKAARILGMQVLLASAGGQSDIEPAFAKMAERQVGVLVVSADPMFVSQHRQLVALALRHAIPAIFTLPEAVKAGGLMSYGPKNLDIHRQLGVYAGRILKGDKPSDLPVQRPTKFELVINLKTAKALGLTIPETLLATADEVIQ